MLVHSFLFVLLSLMSRTLYICTVFFEQINGDDDDDDEQRYRMIQWMKSNLLSLGFEAL